MATERTFKDSFYTLIGPLLLAIVGWYASSTLQEIKQDVKLLLEDRATMKEQIIQLERRIKALENANTTRQPVELSTIFDKPKTLVLTEQGFQYV